MTRLGKTLVRGRKIPGVALAAICLLPAWMGEVNGGYFVGGWVPVLLVLSALLLVCALVGVARIPNSSGWSLAAVGLLVAYALWTCASILWSANRGTAWEGAGQTLLYALAFVAAVVLIEHGAPRRWAIAATVAGSTVLASVTLYVLPERIEEFYSGTRRLLGTVEYANGETAFLLVPFWAAIYLAGSRRVPPPVRCVALSGAVIAASLAILTQSRGAAAALLLSLPVYFLLSGQRLRGLMALLPVVATLVVLFPGLNAVYLQPPDAGELERALDRALPAVWIAAGLILVYALLWSFFDSRWRVSAGLTRFVGGVALCVVLVGALFGGLAAYERIGNPAAFATEKWEAFKTNDASGQDQSRYLSASGSGRYVLWQTALGIFSNDPVAGVGAHNYEASYYQERERVALSARQAHSLPLEILADKGVVGAALFAAFLVVCLAAGLKERFGYLNSEGKAQVGALVASFAYWFVHAGVEWLWQLPAVTLPAILYLAMLVATWRQARPETSTKRWRLGVAGIAVLAALFVLPLYVSDFYLQRSRAAANPSEALPTVEQAQRFNPINPRLVYREAELASDLGLWDRAEEAYRRAIQLNPEHYEAYMFLGDFHARRGELEEAARYYGEASARNPEDLELDNRAEQLSRSAAGQ